MPSSNQMLSPWQEERLGYASCTIITIKIGWYENICSLYILYPKRKESDCYGLNYISLKSMLKLQPPAPQNVGIFRDKILKEVMKLK